MVTAFVTAKKAEVMSYASPCLTRFMMDVIKGTNNITLQRKEMGGSNKCRERVDSWLLHVITILLLIKK